MCVILDADVPGGVVLIWSEFNALESTLLLFQSSLGSHRAPARLAVE